jgi:hypothetical protein
VESDKKNFFVVKGLISSGFYSHPVVLVQSSVSAKNSKSYTGLACSIGNWKTIALAYWDE